ncbi:integral peroxisomal membrane peroxin-domain-containing protein [Catenaria anguillulae PL171]|uniref:Integral peroxisomal membrane peroxin-domain-containing protein n=1 Tax=Catenaria anguillulae PL171 TaxID=765915 RepID=A0A1Y2HSX9_9FUNG|nr:integral peroxisomal membrane peroxin-domain-containing protein [Catenaria anguillulae PL171]
MARALATSLPADTITTIAKVQQRQAEAGSSSAVATSSRKPQTQTQDDAASKKGWRSMVDDIIVSTSKHAARMEIKPREPSLNLLTTTPKNMTRFVSRTGGAHAFEITVKDVLSWRNKTLTLLVLAVFTLVCLYPLTIVVAPQFLIAYSMAVSYYDHTKAKARREAEGKAPKQPKPVDMDPAPKLKPAEYRDNLQFIQNSMGMFCDAYDTVVLFQRQYLNWDYPENALTFLKVVVSSVIPSVALFIYVPLNHLILAVGWLVFIANTPLAIAVSETLTPVLLEILNENWEFAKGIAKKWPEVMKIKPRRGRRNPDGSKASGAGSGSELGVPEEGLYMVAIYENQRWWLGLGFINYLLTSERPAWSDYSGTIPLPPRSSYAPPPGFDFLDADWQVDRQWSVATPDTDGWVYSDHLWGNPRSAAGVGSLTRRRKWVRRVVRRVDPLEAAAAARAAIGSPSSASVLPTPPNSASPAASVVAGAGAEDVQAAKPRSASVSSNTTLFRGGPQDTESTASASMSRSGSNESAESTNQGPTVSTSAGLSSVPIKATNVAGVLVNEEDESLVTVMREEVVENGDDNDQDRDEIEYILELDGEEIVLEGIKSLDSVDMDRLREMVRAIKRDSRMSARSGGSGKVRKIRVE